MNLINSTVDYLLRLQESVMDFYWHYSSKVYQNQNFHFNFHLRKWSMKGERSISWERSKCAVKSSTHSLKVFRWRIYPLFRNRTTVEPLYNVFTLYRRTFTIWFYLTISETITRFIYRVHVSVIKWPLLILVFGMQSMDFSSFLLIWWRNYIKIPHNWSCFESF